MYESIKALEVRNSIVFNISFPNNTILLCFFFFFFNWLILLNPAVIAQMFIPTTVLVIPTGTKTNDANAEEESKTCMYLNYAE